MRPHTIPLPEGEMMRSWSLLLALATTGWAVSLSAESYSKLLTQYPDFHAYITAVARLRLQNEVNDRCGDGGSFGGRGKGTRTNPKLTLGELFD